MSLQGLISGSECALPSNPLAQVLKHTDSDRSAQRDRIVGPSSSRLQYLPSSSTTHASEADLHLARKFFDHNSGIHTQSSPGSAAQVQQAFDFLRRLDSTDLQHQHAYAEDPVLHEKWTIAETQKHVAEHQLPVSSSWANEFGAIYSNGQVPSHTLGHHSQVNTAQNSVHYMNHPTPLYRPPIGSMGMGMYSLSRPQSFTPVQDNGKGKEKARDDAFEAAFAQFASETQTTATIEQVDETKLEEVQSSLQSTSLEDSCATESEDANEEIQKYLDIESKLWDQFKQAELPANDGGITHWEREYNQLMQEGGAELGMDYGASMRGAWEGGMGNLDLEDLDLPVTMKFDEEGIPQLGPYVFDSGNKYLNEPEARSALARAKELLENNGSLSEAALLLEAAVQKGDLGEGGYEAWILLGETRCMDEREEAGIRALTEGLKLAEQAKAEGIGMMSLAIAFTNEGYERGAYSMLKRWLRARFPGMTIADTTGEPEYMTWAARERITEAFLAVARAQHAEGIVDPDVQAGLGVLFYSIAEYGRAQDCFGAALSVRPQDYLLWNRLGSSLSNDERPEEALGAYREALRLRPTYTRAIYNVGVACLNIGAAKEAVDHFLSALALQETKSGDKSEQLWSTLRRALLSLGRTDLAEKAVPSGDLEAFRAEGFDF